MGRAIKVGNLVVHAIHGQRVLEQIVGSDGEIETQSTAFDRRKSYDISELVRPGQPITIAIAVYDWYGAGGIFRPVTLSTEPLSEQRPWLK